VGRDEPELGSEEAGRSSSSVAKVENRLRESNLFLPADAANSLDGRI